MNKWQEIESEYNKAQQMGAQAVAQYIKVGQMLLDLKASLPHGEFKAKVSRAILLPYPTAAKLMKLAQHRDLLEQHNPTSQREALELIKEHHPPQPRYSWRKIANAEGVLSITNNYPTQKHIRDQLNTLAGCDITLESNKEKLIAACRQWLVEQDRHQQAEANEQAEQSIAQLTPKQQSKVEKAMRAYQRKLDLENEEKLRQRLDEVLPMYAEEYAKYKEFNDAYSGVFTEQEYRTILACLHPDRAPTDRHLQFTAAFQLFRSKHDMLCGAKASSSPSSLPSSVAELLQRRRTH